MAAARNVRPSSSHVSPGFTDRAIPPPGHERARVLAPAVEGEAAAQRQRVDEKIRWLLVEHCLDDTPANRAHLMQLRWPIPKVKKR
jgi:hypothetical protein